jgi:hypothetical protein
MSDKFCIRYIKENLDSSLSNLVKLLPEHRNIAATGDFIVLSPTRNTGILIAKY